MPTTGSGKFPYPNTTAVPDVPADMLLLAQRTALIGGAGVGYVADATALAATITNGDAFTGWIVYHAAADAYVQYNGAAFKLYGTKTFASAAAQTTWNSSYSGLLDVGSLSYRADTQITDRWSGSVWQAWSSPWISRNPTITNVTLGGGTQNFLYQYVNGDIHERVKWVWGATAPTWAAVPNFPLQAAPSGALYGTFSQMGGGNVLDSSAGSFFAITANWTGSGQVCSLYAVNTAAAAATFLSITASVPITAIGVGDSVTLELNYTPA